MSKCQWDGCTNRGIHKAPLGYEHEGKHLYFCINHVREYNKTYNYFSGLDDDSTAKLRREVQTEPPLTWKTGIDRKDSERGQTEQRSWQACARAQARGYDNAYIRGTAFVAGRNEPRHRKLKTLEKKSFEILGIVPLTPADQITSRYKDLVKRHHPDANGGNRSTEDLLQKIIQSYKILKQAGFC